MKKIIKVCGMRDAANIRKVEALEPDIMGFICAEKSPRFVSAAPQYLPQTCRRAGVFVNPDIGYVRERIAGLGLDMVQLHGNESPEFCAAIASSGTDVIKAFSISSGKPFPDTTPYESVCRLFVFDTACATYGGSGRSFDWSLTDDYRGRTPFLLSGGIGSDCIAGLAAFRHPMFAGVDLNSRFEISPALKDTALLGSFINTFRKLNQD